MRSGPLENIEPNAADLASIAKALNLDGGDAIKLAEFRSNYNAASRWFASLIDYKCRIPTVELFEKMSLVNSAAARAVRHGAAILVARSIPVPSCLDVDPASLPRPRPIRFGDAIKRLLKALGFDPDCLVNETTEPHVVRSLELSDDPFNCKVFHWASAVANYENDPLNAVVFADQIAKRAEVELEKIRRVRKLTVRHGHDGDAAFNGWIDDMLNLYVKFTGRKVATSVKDSSKQDAGKATGPLVNFMTAAVRPVEDILIEIGVISEPLSPDAWRSRIRTAQKLRTKKPHAQKQD